MPLARTAASVAIAPQYLMGASPDGWGGGAPSPPYYNNNGQQHQGLDLSALMRHEGIVGGGGVGACVSVTHSLGPYGMYQAGTLDPSALNVLRRVCLASPSDSIHTNMRELFDQDTLAVLQQGSHSHQAALVKLADGFAIVAPTHNNRVLGVLKDSYLCMRRGEDPSDAPVLGPNGARSAFYSIANPPGEDHSVKHFTMVYHDGVCEAGQISRFAPANHAIAMIAAAIPLSVPRVIYQAASLGTLMGECVSGEGAHLLKTTFLKLVQSSGGCDGTGVYNVPIVTSGQIARLLQLNTPQGCIALTRCADGMVGYRQREDGLKAFIFVATSPDFLSGTPSLDGDIQVYKINYSCAKSTAPRIFICPSGGSTTLDDDTDQQRLLRVQLRSALSEMAMKRDICPPLPNPFDVPAFDPTHLSTQSVLNTLEIIIRRIMLADAGSHEFPMHCMARAMWLSHMGIPPANEAVARASMTVLTPAPQAFSADNHSHHTLHVAACVMHHHAMSAEQPPQQPQPIF